MDATLRQEFQFLLFSFSSARKRIPSEELEPLANVNAALPWPSFFQKRRGAPATAVMRTVAALRARRLTLMLALERKYGDGHYAERKELLDTVLGYLDTGRVDLQKVFNILDTTLRRRAVIQAAWRHVDERRTWTRETDTVMRNLLKWVQRAERVWSEEPPDRLRSALHTLDAFLTVARAEPPPKKPLSRPKAGHQPEPWVHRARRQLSAAGVTQKELREDLLMAVTLIRFRVPADRRQSSEVNSSQKNDDPG